MALISFCYFFAERYAAYEEPGKEGVEAGRYLRAAVAAFVKSGGRGLKEWGCRAIQGKVSICLICFLGEGGFLCCADLGSLGNTLVNLFKNNTATATFEDPRVYDESCKALGA